MLIPHGSTVHLGEILRPVGSREIAIRLGLSRQRIQQLADRDDFPAPLRELKMGRIWWEHEVEEWIHRWRAGEPPSLCAVRADDGVRQLAERLADHLAEGGQAFLDDEIVGVLTEFLRLFLATTRAGLNHSEWNEAG
ncbi:helix-turn-helix transcriptional regulator [Actinoplanes sp. NPDC020271]|uniref:helix-turn-helix transcriptional regulator n=1 Tax=Actinoplanes sp. NPDC020271 TaxID=3363896 RepID=UPI0037948442